MFFIFMFLIFIMLMMISMLMYFNDKGIMVEWLFMDLLSMNLEMYMMFDWVSLLFISLIMLISSLILLYSMEYMVSDKHMGRFIILVLLFILSMIMMIISPNVFSILFGWDGLGLISYCLIIYYHNYSSYNSGMVTVLCNRIGDVGLLMSIGLLMMNGSWNNFMMLDSNSIIIYMLVLAAITKSAQIPFSSWLPMAMAAPTPVSALVHSSTLVTAGIYLMIRFNKFLFMGNISMYLFFISVFTMFMAGLMANFEFDLKKIIALSTLSQLGLMMMNLSLKLGMLSFFHLLTHAIFKSMLFMCAGIMIHLMNNNQDIRVYGSLNEFIPFTMMSFYIANLSLSGFPFLAGFYSKDFIMEMVYMYKVGYFMLIFIILSLMFTVMYSFRLFYYLFFYEMKFFSFIYIKENSLMNMSMMLLMIFSVISGSVLNWLFLYDLYMPYLNFYLKMITLFMCFISLVIIKIFMYLKYNYKYKYFIKYIMSSMWNLNYLMMIIYKPVFLMSFNFSMNDLLWMEYSSRMMGLKFIIENMMFKMSIFKIFIFISLFMNMFMFIYMMI
uniref:NADH-ubiquinone oxidoreductase chain 5 n=1 Tax=Dolichoderus sibiricus TaxID=609446 RepID=A0A6B9BK02_9HYME|nr:NADH dehydrogenase subunit 5 [Dolichoderus sibiricus]